MISINITHKQWNNLAFFRDDNDSDVMHIRNSRDMKQHIKDTYHGEYIQDVGFGTVWFEHEHHLTWFLLNV